MKHQDKALRFGVIAVKKGYVSPDQVIDALNVQVREEFSIGKHRRIGVILMEQGYLTTSQVEEIAKEVERVRGGT